MENRATAPQILLFIILPLIPLVIFWILPLFFSVWLSFTDWDYISPTINYVGGENYIELIRSSEFVTALKNTFFFTIFSFIPIIFFGFTFAVMINKLKTTSKLLQGLMFSPWITPMIGMSIVWSWMFDSRVGPINLLLNFFGWPSVNWLTDSRVAIWTIIIVTVWKNIGWAMLFFSDALSKIPLSLFEAADTEGVGWWKKTRYILIPLVSPTTLFLFIITTLDSLQAYDQINVLTQGGPSGSTRTLLYLYYQLAFEQFNMGQATALAVLILGIAMILSGLSIGLSKKYVYY